MMISRFNRSYRSSHFQRTGDNRGFLLPLMMVLFFVTLTSAFGIMSVVAAKYAKTSRDTLSSNAVYAAEAGVSDTVMQLQDDTSFSGYPDTPSGRKQFYSDSARGKAEYASSVSDNGNETYTITATGYIYRTPSATTAAAKKTIQVLVHAAQSAAPNTAKLIYAGPGGITINSTSGSIDSKNVYTTGKVKLTGTTAHIGTNNRPVNLYAGNIACEVNGVYPAQCASSDQPITISGNSPKIVGSVCATDQTNSNRISPGNGGAGLQIGCVPPPLEPPSFDKQAFVNSMTATKNASEGSCGFRESPVELEANTTYNGNININRCDGSTIKGNLYITGNLNLTNSSIRVDNNLGTTQPIIVVNGSATFNGGNVAKNSSGTSIRVISFKSSNTTCSNSSSCVSLNSQDSKNSVSMTTASIVGASTNLNGATLYSYFGTASINSSSGSVGTLQGQSINISTSSGGIGDNYETETDLFGSTTGSFSLLDYRQLY